MTRRQALCDIALEEQFKVNTTGGGTALPGRIGACLHLRCNTCVFRKANKDRHVSRKVKSYKNDGKLRKTTFEKWRGLDLSKKLLLKQSQCN